MRLMQRDARKALLVLCLGMVTATPVAAQGEPVVIAGTFDLSGAAADVGKDAFEGAKLAIEVINGRGGVLGRKLELRHQDNGTNPQKSVDQATAMIRDGAKFLMAPQSSGSAIAVNKAVSGKLKVPTCVSTSTADDITIKDFQPYIFTMSANSYMESRAIATRLAKEPFKRYAVISADYAGGRSGANRFKEFIKEFNPNAEIVVEEYPKFGATDYTASINKVLAAKPDYVWSILFGADLITFTKQAQAVGFFDQVNKHFLALYDGNTLKALGDAAVVGTEGWQRVPVNIVSKGAAEGQAYVSGFKAKNGVYPSDWAGLAYDCVMIWAQAAEAAKSIEADAVMKAIETTEFKSVRGPLKFGAFDHQGEVPVYIGKVVQSKEFGQPLLDIAEVIPGSKARPAEDVVRKLRGN